MTGKITIAFLLAALVLGGCQAPVLKEDTAIIRQADAQAIVSDWGQMMSEQYPAATVFRMTGLGDIGRALANHLRSRGFGVIEEPQTPTNADEFQSFDVEANSGDDAQEAALVEPEPSAPGYANAVLLEVRSTRIGPEGDSVLVSLVIAERIISKSYTLPDNGTPQGASAFSVLQGG